MPYTEPSNVAAGYTQKVYRKYGGTIDNSYLNKVIVGTRSGQAVPEWKSKVGKGQQAGSPYYIDSYTVKNFEDERKTVFQFPGNPTVFEDVFVGVQYPATEFAHNFTPIPPETVDKALAKVLGKIRSNRTDLNGLVVLGELRETIAMLRRPFSSLTELVTKHITRLNREKARVRKLPFHVRRNEWSKAITGTWLEAVFGIMPLYADIEGILKAVQRLARQDPKRVRVQGQADLTTSSVVDLGSRNVMASNLFLYSSTIMDTETTASVRYVVGLECQEVVDQTPLSRLLEASGLTLENFVPAIYELMPWSFLIDYFSNLGTLIEAGTTDTSEVRWVVRTDRMRSERILTTTPESAAPYVASGGAVFHRESGGYGHSVITRTTVDRTISDSLGTPKLHVFHPGNSFKKMANITALLEQQRLGSRDLTWLRRRGG